MATINGNDILIKVGTATIGSLTSNSFKSQNTEVLVTSKNNNGAKAVLAGGNEASISFEGYFNPTETYGFSDLVGIHAAKTTVTIQMIQTGAYTITAQALLNTLDWTAPLNAGSTFSGEFTITGVWTFTETPPV